MVNELLPSVNLESAIFQASLDASALFFIVDRLEDTADGGEDEQEEALAMRRVACSLAKKLKDDLRALSGV